MDIEILKWFQEVFHEFDFLNYFMKYVTYIGEFGLGAVVAGVALLIFKKTRWVGVGVLIAFLLNVLIVNVILKSAVNRLRPWQAYPDLGFQEFHNSIGVREPTDSSFPSGHTASLFAAAVCIILHYKVKGLPALLIAFVVALSRIYLCMHFPTDVLAGATIGSACGVAGFFIAKPLKKLVDKKFKHTDHSATEDSPAEPPTDNSRD